MKDETAMLFPMETEHPLTRRRDDEERPKKEKLKEGEGKGEETPHPMEAEQPLITKKKKKTAVLQLIKG